MRNTRILPILVFLYLISSLSAYGAEKYAGEFLTLGVGARPLSMGGSYVAISDDSTAAYWNPAGLGKLTHSEAAFMHSTLFGLDSYDFFNYVQPFGKGGVFGLSWLRVGVDDILVTRLAESSLGKVSSKNRPEEAGRFNNVDNAFLFSYGRKIDFNLSSVPKKRRVGLLVGANLKFIYIASYRRNALGLGGDCGILWETQFGNRLKSGKFAVGVAAFDFFRTKLYWNTTPDSPQGASNTDTIMPNFKIGASFQQNIDAISSRIILTADTDSLYDFEMHYGLEYSLADLLALRVGLQEKKGPEKLDKELRIARDLTLGAGLRIAFLTGSAFAVDYAFLSSDELGNSNRISLVVRF